MTGYWDKDKQQTRQKRRYLGVKDLKTKEVVKKYNVNNAKTSKDFGGVYLLKSIAKRLRLTKCLEEAFPDNWEAILDLAVFKIIS